MMDEETGSLWSHVIGESLQGTHKGKILKTLQVVQTNWNTWVKQHQDTKVLKKSEEIKSSSYEKYFENPNRLGIFRTIYLQDRMPGKTLVYGISSGVHQLAVLDSLLIQGKLRQTDLGDDRIIIFKSKDGGLRVFKDGGYIFKEKTESRFFMDVKTRSIWDFDQGKCIKGKLSGTELEAVPVTLAYWFAWSTYFPNTEVLD